MGDFPFPPAVSLRALPRAVLRFTSEPRGNFPCKCDKFFRAGLLRKRKGRLKMLCEPLKPLVASPV